MKESLKTAVQLAKQGEQEGIRRIYRETCEDVYFRSRLMMGNRKDAQNLVKQVYIVVFRTIQTLNEPEKMEKWLYTVLYKLGERECRKNKGMELEKEKTAPSWEGNEAPSTTAEKQKIIRIMKSGYKKIGTAERMVCLAHYYERWSIEELARLWKCPEEKLRGILEYARIELGLMCTEKGYFHVDISEDIMYLMFELLREDAEEEIHQARLGQMFEEIAGELDYMEGKENDQDDRKKSSRMLLLFIAVGAALVIGLAAVGGNYLGKLVTQNEKEQEKKEETKKKQEKPGLKTYVGNWCDEESAETKEIGKNGINEIQIQSMDEKKVVFDIRRTYGVKENYVFRGANSVTGVINDKTTSFTFTDEKQNRMEGTIEFRENSLKVQVKAAENSESEELDASMDCIMKKDKYNGVRTIPEETEEENDPEDPEGYIFPDSDKRLLTEEDFEGKTKEELRLGRNEIFARHGRSFQTKDLNEWFGEKTWYEPKYSEAEFSRNVTLNSYEKKNIDLILAAESRAH